MPTGLWTDYAASSFAGGNGSSSNPYQIATAAQLARLAKSGYSSSYFILTADIDLSDHYWVPAYQIGQLDGKGYTISNMTINDASAGNRSDIGFFEHANLYRYDNFYLRNITFDNPVINVTSSSYSRTNVGIVCGKVFAEDMVVFETDAVVLNNPSITAQCSASGSSVGGMFGRVDNGSDTTMDAYIIKGGNITCSATYAGGLIGYFTGSEYFTGDDYVDYLDGEWFYQDPYLFSLWGTIFINITNTKKDAYTGGLCGFNTGYVGVYACLSMDFSADGYVGGLFGTTPYSRDFGSCSVIFNRFHGTNTGSGGTYLISREFRNNNSGRTAYSLHINTASLTTRSLYLNGTSNVTTAFEDFTADSDYYTSGWSGKCPNAVYIAYGGMKKRDADECYLTVDGYDVVWHDSDGACDRAYPNSKMYHLVTIQDPDHMYGDGDSPAALVMDGNFIIPAAYGYSNVKMQLYTYNNSDMLVATGEWYTSGDIINVTEDVVFGNLTGTPSQGKVMGANGLLNITNMYTKKNNTLLKIQSFRTV